MCSHFENEEPAKVIQLLFSVSDGSCDSESGAHRYDLLNVFEAEASDFDGDGNLVAVPHPHNFDLCSAPEITIDGEYALYEIEIPLVSEFDLLPPRVVKILVANVEPECWVA